MKQSKSGTERFLSVFIIVCIGLILICGTVIACILYRNHLEAVQEAEEAARKHYVEHNQHVTTFPHRMKINGKTAYLSSVDLFEIKVDHGYVTHLIITIDRGQLTDDDLYWILKGYRYNWELDAYASLQSSDSSSDNETLHFLACRYTDTHIYFFFYTDQQRESLKGRSFYASIEYLKDGADTSDRYLYYYMVDFSGEQYHVSSEFLPTETAKMLLDALEDATS